MRALAFVGLVVAACSFPHGSLQRDDAPRTDGPPSTIDAAIDAAIDARGDAATCSASGLSCLGGAAMAVSCNGGCWVKCTLGNAITETMANAYCNGWGGKLAPIREQADNDCVANTLFYQQASWIGLQQDASATTLAGGWTNNGDGVALTFTNWDPGQPDDQNGSENGQEQCAYIPTSGKWQDADCLGLLYRFSCRRP